MSNCKVSTQNDELACAACGLRWDRSEDAPACQFLPKAGQVAVHHSGKVYTVVGLANVGGSPSHSPAVVLLGANGALWTRTVEDFRYKYRVEYNGTNLARVD